MELNGWTSPQMLRRYGVSARSARARRSYDRIMDPSPDTRQAPASTPAQRPRRPCGTLPYRNSRALTPAATRTKSRHR
jgi:hypothetical protein